MSDTPETDATALAYEIKETGQKVIYLHVSTEFARRLERERDEARQVAEHLRNHLNSEGYLTTTPFPWEKP